jgi:hypothetical protein
MRKTIKKTTKKVQKTTKKAQKFINDFLAPSTKKEKKIRTNFWMFKRFIFDFSIPIIFAYGIYAIIAYTSLRASKKIIKSVKDGDFTQYDKRLKIARQADVVLHILRMIAYGGLVICAFVWLFGYKKPFEYFWPFQQVFLILTVIAELIVRWSTPTDPTSLLLSATILLDYQGHKSTANLSNAIGKDVLSDPDKTKDFLTKLMYSKILGAFVTILATGKLWWDTKFKDEINIFLIIGVIIIISHCFFINYYGLLDALKKLNDNQPTQTLINNSIDDIINKICEILGLKKCLTPEQKEEFRGIIFTLIKNYAKQITDGNGFGFTSSLFNNVDPKKLEKLLFDLAISNGNEHVLEKIEAIKEIAGKYMEVSKFISSSQIDNMSDEHVKLAENVMNTLNQLYNNEDISKEQVENIINDAQTVYEELNKEYNFKQYLDNNSKGENFTNIEYSSLLNK